jgi:tRNA threonylcarbamoyladenosine biosynthesis protein TsaE
MFPELSTGVYEKVSLDDLPGVAKEMLNDAGNIKVWLFTGEMGAGKTTLIKVLCDVLGVRDNMSSPTFSIVNEYWIPGGKIFHFDFFRIKNEAEAYDIGAEEYFYSGNYCFIEWPEKIPGLLPAQHAHITITLADDTFRHIALSVHDGQEKNRI